MSDVSPQLIDRLVAISRALAGHIDPGSAFRATAIEIGTLIPHDHIDLAVLSQDGRMLRFNLSEWALRNRTLVVYAMFVLAALGIMASRLPTSPVTCRSAGGRWWRWRVPSR